MGAGMGAGTGAETGQRLPCPTEAIQAQWKAQACWGRERPQFPPIPCPRGATGHLRPRPSPVPQSWTVWLPLKGSLKDKRYWPDGGP